MHQKCNALCKKLAIYKYLHDNNISNKIHTFLCKNCLTYLGVTYLSAFEYQKQFMNTVYNNFTTLNIELLKKRNCSRHKGNLNTSTKRFNHVWKLDRCRVVQTFTYFLFLSNVV